MPWQVSQYNPWIPTEYKAVEYPRDNSDIINRNCNPEFQEGMEECWHRNGTTYNNQHGRGWRCEECHSKWFTRHNGEQVETSGLTRFRRPGWTPRQR